MRYAVIPSNGRDCLHDCLKAILPQVDLVVLVETRKTGWPSSEKFMPILASETRGTNISYWWNLGLALVATHVARRGADKEPWDVAIVNDDVIVPDGWFDAVSTGMRVMNAAAACSGPVAAHHLAPGPVPLHTRLQGFAFVLAGEKGLRANEGLHWYFTDDYLDWESRKLGGTVMVPGHEVQHLYPNGQMTPEIHVQTARDAQTFFDLYGMRPW